MAAQSSIHSSISSSYISMSRSSTRRIVITNVANPLKLDITLQNLSLDLNTSTTDDLTAISSENDGGIPITLQPCSDAATATAKAKLYAVLEAVADRVEMHANMGQQRNNWNSLLLNSINMMTLTATAMAGITAAQPVHAIKLSSAVLFAAAAGMLVVVNKLQPSQLVEEQRNATRLFKRLHQEIETMLILRDRVTEMDYVINMMERVVALDRAYPLPLIGVMLEKFPAKLEPAVWWPPPLNHLSNEEGWEEEEEEEGSGNNGWSDEMEEEMREIVGVLKQKDKQDYLRLGNMALKLNKMLSILGPVFAGIAAVGSAVPASSSSSVGVLAMEAAVVGGALSTIVNTIEHGGQVGMVVEMYRNCAGFFQNMEESIESAIGEKRVSCRENGELMEMKVSLELGRSLSQLKELAMASASSRQHGTHINDFASKLL